MISLALQKILHLTHPLPLRLKANSILRRLGWRPCMTRPLVRLAMAPASMAHFVESDPMHQTIVGTGCYDTCLSKKVARLATETGGLMIDVGANVGYFSILWAALRPGNRAIAFEPSPRNIRLLQANIADNEGIGGRIELRSVALGKEEGSLAFDLGPEDQSGWGGFASGASFNSLVVQVQRLDDLIPEHEVIAVLKIDCEGADAWVLAGATRLLERSQIKHVFFEVNRQRQRALGIAENLTHEILTAHGYQIECITGDEFEFHAWK